MCLPLSMVVLPQPHSHTCAVTCVSVQALAPWRVPIFPPLSSELAQEGRPDPAAASEQGGFEELVQEGLGASFPQN